MKMPTEHRAALRRKLRATETESATEATRTLLLTFGIHSERSRTNPAALEVNAAMLDAVLRRYQKALMKGQL